MAKKVKLTEKQIKMLKERIEEPKGKVVRITESQYKRVFGKNIKEDKTPINESYITELVADNLEMIVSALRSLVRNQSQEGLDGIFQKMGLTWGHFYGVMTDLGILTVSYKGGKKIYKVSKMMLIRYCKTLYNEFFGPTFDENGKLIDKKDGEPQVKKEMIGLGDDIEMEESNYPAGADNDPNAPWNQEDSPEPHFDGVGEFNEAGVVRSGEYFLLFSKDSSGQLYFTEFSAQSTGWVEYCGNGGPNPECVLNQINAKFEEGQIDLEEDIDIIHRVDESVMEYIESYYGNDGEAMQQVQAIIGGMTETTTAGSVGGSYEAPMGAESPIKRNFNEELNEEDLDETTMSGAATGSYEQPKIWAKNDANWRHGKETMYPNGEIVEDEDCDCDKPVNESKNSLNEALQIRRGMVKDKKQGYKEVKGLIVISDKHGKKGQNETFRNKNALNKAGFEWQAKEKYWWIPEELFDTAKETLSVVNKADLVIDKLEDVKEYVHQAAEGKEAKKDILIGNLEQYIEDLANATDATAMSAEIRRYLTFFSKFHQYSPYNRMLIYLQKPDATKVASYKRWKDTGRQVNKGAKSISILCPKFRKVEVDRDEVDDSNDETKTEKKLSGWITCPVFDISDTTAVSHEGEVPESPEWHSGNEPSEVADELYNHISEVAKNMNIKITQTDARGSEKGYSAGDHINLSSDVAGVGRVATLIHEMAHELMHWRTKSIYYVGDEMRGDKAMLELQAESVSYVVLKHYDLPATHHPTYLALWGANKEKIRKNMELISEVAHFLIKQVDVVAGKDEVTEEGYTGRLVQELFDGLE
jgi:hypothetical protein